MAIYYNEWGTRMGVGEVAESITTHKPYIGIHTRLRNGVPEFEVSQFDGEGRSILTVSINEHELLSLVGYAKFLVSER